jgi:predicted nucleotidyltransferase
MRLYLLEGCRKAAELMKTALEKLLGESLVSVILFGSVARGDVSDTSDIDLLIDAKNLPESRFERIKLFNKAEDLCRDELRTIHERYGITTYFSPIMKDVAEACRISPLYLDIVEDGIVLFDRDGSMSNLLERLRSRLRAMGARFGGVENGTGC